MCMYYIQEDLWKERRLEVIFEKSKVKEKRAPAGLIRERRNRIRAPPFFLMGFRKKSPILKECAGRSPMSR